MKEIQSETTWTVGKLRDYLDDLEGYGYGNAPIQVDVPAGTEAGEVTTSFVVESSVHYTRTEQFNEKYVTRSVRFVLGGA